MELCLYAGSLTRYYSQERETLFQRAGHEVGPAIEVRRPEGVARGEGDPGVVRSAVLAWRDRLNVRLRKGLRTPLDWDESPESPYFTDKPTWGCYSSLLLWAAYSEHPGLPRPRKPVEHWKDDGGFRRSSARSSFPNLMRECELWFPSDFAFQFRATDPTGIIRPMGSAVALRKELATLNARTWRASASTVARWLWQAAEVESTLEAGARFAFAVFKELTDVAVENRLVLRLDY